MKLILILALCFGPGAANLVAADLLDLKSTSPKALMELMQKGTTERHFVAVANSSNNFITAADVIWLLPLLDSADECLPIASSLSSTLPTSKSTVGHEAATMILGFIKKEYPPVLDSSRPGFTPRPDVEKWLLALIQNRAK
jgi:hypothetical protein